MRVVGLLLLLLTAGCGSGQDAAPRPGDEPRRFADYSEPTAPDPQCALPVEQRTTGWFCYDATAP